MPRISNPDARNYAPGLKPFESHTGNFLGVLHTPGHHVLHTGFLPDFYAERGHLVDSDYIVWSFWTPIAWHVADGWVIPDVSYSYTTSSKHQPYLPHGEVKSAYHLPSIRHLPPTAQAIMRAIRNGRGTSAEGRTRKTIDAVLSTGEALLTNSGKDFYPKFLADRGAHAAFVTV